MTSVALSTGVVDSTTMHTGNHRLIRIKHSQDGELLIRPGVVKCRYLQFLEEYSMDVEFTPEIKHECDRSLSRDEERGCKREEDAQRGNKFRIVFPYGFHFKTK